MQNKHRKKGLSLLVIFFFLLPVISYGQDENNRLTEVGIDFYGLDNFGLAFKKPLKNGKYLAIDGSLGINYSPKQTNNNFGQSLINLSSDFSANVEKRIPIGDKIYFAHGIGLGFHLAYNVARTDVMDFIDERTSENFALSLNPFYKMGFQYHFSDKFYLEASIKPGFNISYLRNSLMQIQGSETIEQISSTINGQARFSSKSAKISFFYRFKREKNQG